MYLYETMSPEPAAFLKELREAAWRHPGEHFEGPPASMDASKEVYGSVALPIYEMKGNEPGWADFVTAW